MLNWMMQWAVWILIRAVFTFCCIITLQNLILSSGYRIEFNTLLIAAICIIITIRMWAPTCAHKNGDK